MYSKCCTMWIESKANSTGEQQLLKSKSGHFIDFKMKNKMCFCFQKKYEKKHTQPNRRPTIEVKIIRRYKKQNCFRLFKFYKWKTYWFSNDLPFDFRSEEHEKKKRFSARHDQHFPFKIGFGF